MSQLGKMGGILWAFANGYDDSLVKMEHVTELPPGKLAKVIPFSFQVQNDNDDFVL